MANKLESVCAGSPPYLRATTAAGASSGQTLVWTRVEGNSDVIEVQTGGTIKIKKDGVFVVNALIQHYNTGNSTTLELYVNGTSAASVVDSSNNTHQHLTPLTYVLMAKADDKISVVYKGNGNAYANSSIVIYQLR